MAAVIRVKRSLSDEPLDAFVLSCKKRKIDQENAHKDDIEVSALLKFAGTIDSQEKNIFEHIKRPPPSKIDLEEQFKKRAVDVNAKLRLEKRQESKKNRYKVVNCFRSQPQPLISDNLSSITGNADDKITIFDIETDVAEEPDNSNVNNNDGQKQSNYVYDLYYSAFDDLVKDYLEEDISVYPLSDNLVFDGARGQSNNLDSDDDDSDDSNAECCWKNDYPDESDMESVNDDDMVKAIAGLDVQDSLSSDEGEEGFVYSIDSEAAGFEEDIDQTDVQRYGERYAVFKARHIDGVPTTQIGGFSGDLYYGDIDEDEYYY